MGSSGVNYVTSAQASTRVVQRASVGNSLDVGQMVPARDRWNSTAVGPGTSGNLALAYFQADRSETINTLTAFTGATAAGATPTLCRYGLFTVAVSGDITLVAATVNDTALFAAVNTAYPKALSASYGLTADALYAVGLIVVTATTMPTFHGVSYAVTAPYNTVSRLSPAMTGRVTGQTDLPTIGGTIPAGSIIGLGTATAVQLS